MVIANLTKSFCLDNLFAMGTHFWLINQTVILFHNVIFSKTTLLPLIKSVEIKLIKRVQLYYYLRAWLLEVKGIES